MIDLDSIQVYGEDQWMVSRVGNANKRGFQPEIETFFCDLGLEGAAPSNCSGSLVGPLHQVAPLQLAIVKLHQLGPLSIQRTSRSVHRSVEKRNEANPLRRAHLMEKCGNLIAKAARSGPEHPRQGRVRGHGSRVADAGVLDVNNAVAALPQAPQLEAGPDSAQPAPPTLYTENPRVTKKPRIELPKPVEDYNLEVKQATETNQSAVSLFRPSRGGKSNCSTLSKFFLAKQKLRPIPSRVAQAYSRPPHPYDVGKVSQVNICPVCEKYTVTEFDRSADTVPCSIDDTTLRARFNCGLCRKVFDLGIAMFDPRGIPGVTLFEGEDRFRPPVPPRGKYPCPRCWMSTRTSFHFMTLYLREESKVQCEPACPAERLNPSSWEEPEEKPDEEKREARNIIRTVLGFSKTFSTSQVADF